MKSPCRSLRDYTKTVGKKPAPKKKKEEKK